MSFSYCNSKSSFHDRETIYYDIVNEIYAFEFITQVFFSSIFCLVALLFNVLSIIVRRNKNKDIYLKNCFFKSFKINYFSNIAYCLVIMVHLSITCLAPIGKFCPYYYSLKVVQFTDSPLFRIEI